MTNPHPVESTLLGPVAWREPTRLGAAWHRLKVWCHVLARSARNLWGGPARLRTGSDLVNAPVVAEHRSPLWADGRADEFVLRCGKVQNLRVAARGLHGIEVAPGQTLSFWAQVGRPSTLRGFAVGREIISGCVVPTVGGGLCQLSNALASLATALDARFVERHRHSARIEAQVAASEDATVAWNHIDLRFSTDFAFRIEAELTADELVLRAKAIARARPRSVHRTPLPPVRDERPVARGCLTCDQTRCFRHQGPATHSKGRTAVLLNERFPELARWLAQQDSDADWMVPWVRPRLRRNAWRAPSVARLHIAHGPSWKRALRQRLHAGEGGKRQAGRLQLASDLAAAYARKLSPAHTELVLTQDLLVPLWRAGTLGGRTYVVYVPELPSSEIQSRLDLAAAANPGAPSLVDFRVDVAWQHDEWRALAGARRRMTPHHEVFCVLQAAGLEVELLPWEEPSVPVSDQPARGNGLTLTLAGSALARKGAHEVAAAARALGARVEILGTPPAHAADWKDVDWISVRHASEWWSNTDVVVLPAYVEHQPRALLKAIAAGVPVVATSACGLGARAGLIEVPAGDTESLLKAIQAAVAQQLHRSA